MSRKEREVNLFVCTIIQVISKLFILFFLFFLLKIILQSTSPRVK